MATVGIFDSGSGGLSVLKELLKLLPRERYIYYSDSANCPYGDKSPEFVRRRASDITRLLLDKGADIIVVACNTATAAAISALRDEFRDTPFVGMEPAVKPAALGTRTGLIGVLATAGTLKGSLYLDTRSRFQDNVRIVERVGRGFVELVENGTFSGPEAERVCKASLQPLLDEGADRIVLGCTHYPFLLPVLEKIASEHCISPNGSREVQFIDPAPAVARRTALLLPAGKTAAGGVELLSSGSTEALERSFSFININK